MIWVLLRVFCVRLFVELIISDEAISEFHWALKAMNFKLNLRLMYITFVVGVKDQNVSNDSSPKYDSLKKRPASAISTALFLIT